MPRRDLRATTPEAQRLEPSEERERGLRRVPAACELRGHRTAAVHLHPETIEAECLRPFDSGVVASGIAVTVACFACLASGTHPPRLTRLTSLTPPHPPLKPQPPSHLPFPDRR